MSDSEDQTLLAYVAPFAAFIAVMAVERAAGIPIEYGYPVRVAVSALALLLLSRPVVSLRVAAPLLTIGMGILVFVVWVGPDLLFGPGYRHFWIFENSLAGKAESSIPPPLRESFPFLALRVAGSVLLVPVIEEIFWRGWLMRWLIRSDFTKVPFGQYNRFAFWVVALLFATEHGPYWEVGLAAGVLYNWLAIRTKSLGSCILAHAITNALLAAYVILRGEWQYWL
jgi:CAAX prenyl protease-like protein